jgi:hypothetical protein
MNTNIQTPTTVAEIAALVNALVMGGAEFRERHHLTEKVFFRRLDAGLLPPRIDICGRPFFRREDGENWRDPIAERRAAKSPATK